MTLSLGLLGSVSCKEEADVVTSILLRKMVTFMDEGGPFEIARRAHETPVTNGYEPKQLELVPE